MQISRFFRFLSEAIVADVIAMVYKIREKFFFEGGGKAKFNHTHSTSIY